MTIQGLFSDLRFWISVTLRIVPPLGCSLRPILWAESKSCGRRRHSASISLVPSGLVGRALWARSALSVKLHHRPPPPRAILATELCPSLPANFSVPFGSHESFLRALLCGLGLQPWVGLGAIWALPCLGLPPPPFSGSCFLTSAGRRYRGSVLWGLHTHLGPSGVFSLPVGLV